MIDATLTVNRAIFRKPLDQYIAMYYMKLFHKTRYTKKKK